jgi:UDP-N-acetylglucosamine acyltransferase
LAIHPTAIIDPKAELDSSVEVGPFCVIDGHVQVAADCRLYQGVYLTGWTRIAEECELHPGVIVGHAPQDIKYGQERSYCRIGRRTILREYTTVHRGTEPESQTVVGENCFVLSASHIAHNCQVGDNVTLIQNAILGGHARIGDRTTVGGAAGVHQFVRVGEGAMIAGTARVCQDVLPFALVDPAGRISGINRIGLRRANTPREHVLDIREAYRVLFGMGLPFHEAVGRLSETVKTPAGNKILEFVQAKSSRGIAGRSRSRNKPRNATATED